MCAFVARASSSGIRRGSPSNRPVSDPSYKHGTSAMRPPEDSELLLLPSYGGCDMFVYDMYNKLM